MKTSNEHDIKTKEQAEAEDYAEIFQETQYVPCISWSSCIIKILATVAIIAIVVAILYK